MFSIMVVAVSAGDLGRDNSLLEAAPYFIPSVDCSTDRRRPRVVFSIFCFLSLSLVADLTAWLVLRGKGLYAPQLSARDYRQYL